MARLARGLEAAALLVWVFLLAARLAMNHWSVAGGQARLTALGWGLGLAMLTRWLSRMGRDRLGSFLESTRVEDVCACESLGLRAGSERELDGAPKSVLMAEPPPPSPDSRAYVWVEKLAPLNAPGTMDRPWGTDAAP